jgi:predicted O-methyltransferase YrrM
MGTPLATRLRLKIRKIARELTQPAAEREFNRMWPLIDSIEGWLPQIEGQWLFNTAQSLPDLANIVEIGSYKGRSTCCLALGCRSSKKRVFAIDSFDGGPDLPKANSLKDFSENLKRSGLAGYVQPVVGLSGDMARAWDKPIHFLFIDGSHAYEDVVADFVGFYLHVAPGGIIALHDVGDDWPGVLNAWHRNIKDLLAETGHCGTIGYGRKPPAIPNARL